MKGIVMNVLADMVEKQFGMPEWNAILSEAGSEGAYTAAARYDDQELLDLVGIISRRQSMPIEDLVFAFGEFMFPAFYERYPALIDAEVDFLPLLASIDSVIHVEVNKLYPGAVTPAFEEEWRNDSALMLRYRSQRKMCKLAEGLISGAAKHFNTTYALQHEPCMHRGADHCGLLVTLT